MEAWTAVLSVIVMITWLAVKTFFKKVSAWCKKYWQLLVGASIPVVIWILTRNSDHLDEVLKRVREDHEKEVGIINRSHEDELNARDEAVRRYQETIAEVEARYAEASEELDSRKRKQIENIIKNHADDPEEITRRIASLTGFEIYNK